MTALYKIAQNFKESINDSLMQDELTLDQVDALNRIEGEIEDKAVIIAKYIRNFETEAEAVRSAMKEMQDRAKRLDNKAKMLSSYLKNNLESCGIKEVRKSPHFVIKIKQNPASVIIDNESKISDEYKKVKEVVTIDKAAIKNDIENGVIVDGARIEKQTRLEIK